jgi:hypothetical protein
MMIDGAHEGAFATHPTIADRVAAIISVTGSMALIAPAHRDTRPAEPRAGEGFAREPAPGLQAAFLRSARQSANAASARVASAGEFNRFGLTREMSLGAVAAFAVLLWVHGADLRNPAALVKGFDRDSMQTLSALTNELRRCKLQAYGSLIGLAAQPTDCNMDKMIAASPSNDGLIGMLKEQQTKGLYKWPDGRFRRVAPSKVQAEVAAERCFQTDSYEVGDHGLHAVTEQPSEGETVSLPRYLALADAAARRVNEASDWDLDAALVAYFQSRKSTGEVIHRFFGDPGLEVAAARYADPDHREATTRLHGRLGVSDLAKTLSPREGAEIELLGAAPQDFIPCVARRGPKSKA